MLPLISFQNDFLRLVSNKIVILSDTVRILLTVGL